MSYSKKSPENLSSADKEKNDKKVIILLLLIIAFALLFLLLNDSQKLELKKIIVKQQHNENVNSEIFEVNEKIRIQKEKAMLENQKIFLKDSQPSTSERRQFQNKDSLEVIQDKRSEDIAEKLGRKKLSEELPSSPDEVLQYDLYLQQIDNNYDEAYRAEYAKEFIANARKHGYDVRLDSNFRVISVQKINRNGGGDSPSFPQ